MLHGSIHRNSKVLIQQVWRTESALERMRGLLGREELKPGQALIIDPCSSVHTIGMRYSIDIIFVDKTDTITKVCHSLVSLRMAASLRAKYTIELAAGEIDRLGVSVGEQLQWRLN